VDEVLAQGAIALADVPHTAARRLHHLVVGAAALVDEPVAKDHSRVIDRLRDFVTAQLLAAAMRQQDVFGIGHDSSFIGMFPASFEKSSISGGSPRLTTVPAERDN